MSTKGPAPLAATPDVLMDVFLRQAVYPEDPETLFVTWRATFARFREWLAEIRDVKTRRALFIMLGNAIVQSPIRPISTDPLEMLRKSSPAAAIPIIESDPEYKEYTDYVIMIRSNNIKFVPMMAYDYVSKDEPFLVDLWNKHRAEPDALKMITRYFQSMQSQNKLRIQPEANIGFIILDSIFTTIIGNYVKDYNGKNFGDSNYTLDKDKKPTPINIAFSDDMRLIMGKFESMADVDEWKIKDTKKRIKKWKNRYANKAPSRLRQRIDESILNILHSDTIFREFKKTDDIKGATFFKMHEPFLKSFYAIMYKYGWKILKKAKYVKYLAGQNPFISFIIDENRIPYFILMVIDGHGKKHIYLDETGIQLIFDKTRPEIFKSEVEKMELISHKINMADFANRPIPHFLLLLDLIGLNILDEAICDYITKDINPEALLMKYGSALIAWAKEKDTEIQAHITNILE